MGLPLQLDKSPACNVSQASGAVFRKHRNALLNYHDHRLLHDGRNHFFCVDQPGNCPLVLSPLATVLVLIEASCSATAS